MAVLEKNKKVLSHSEFNIILNNILHTDKIGHLFFVDIKFYFKNEKSLLSHEIYSPIFEEKKLIKPYERSILQLLSVRQETSRNKEKGLINTFKHNTKTHSTMKEKKFVPLYVEHLHFLVTGARWVIIKIYKHFIFEQAPFKKEFVTINQNARQKGRNSCWKEVL